MCFFGFDGEGVERSEGLEDGVLASGARTRDTDGRLETFLQRCDQSQTEIHRGSDQNRLKAPRTESVAPIMRCPEPRWFRRRGVR